MKIYKLNNLQINKTIDPNTHIHNAFTSFESEENKCNNITDYIQTRMKEIEVEFNEGNTTLEQEKAFIEELTNLMAENDSATIRKINNNDKRIIFEKELKDSIEEIKRTCYRPFSIEKDLYTYGEEF